MNTSKNNPIVPFKKVKGGKMAAIFKKDYNNQLEKIIENKKYSENAKSLLLSMMYKIEAAYNDYKKVKQDVETKDEFITKTLEIIHHKIEKITIAQKDTEEDIELRKTNNAFLVNFEKGEITTYPIEKNLLRAIYEINKPQIYIDKKYNLPRNAIIYDISTGINIEKVEILNDFNGWSWNANIENEKDIEPNIIYKSIWLIIENEKLKNICIKESEFIGSLRNALLSICREEEIEEFIEKMCKLAINSYSNINPKEKERLLEEKENIENECKKIENKANYIEEISKAKKEKLRKIIQITDIISDKKRLEQEFIKINENLPNYRKIFNISNLENRLKKQKNNLLEEVEEINFALEPKNYVANKEKIRKNLYMVEDLQKEEKIDTYDDIIEFQKVFLECFKGKIDKLKNKKEVLKTVYQFRYYKYLPIKKNMYIKDVNELQENIIEVEKKIIQKAIAFNAIKKDKEIDYQILKEIFNSVEVNIENWKGSCL